MNIFTLWNSWKHFGTRMMISKAWEKFVVDQHRFRSGLHRNVPTFAPVQTMPVPQYNSKTSPKQICYFIHYFFPDKQGGTERFVLSLAREQIKLGNSVRVITLGKRPESSYECRVGKILYTEFEFEGIPVTQLRYLRAPRGLYYDEIYLNDPEMAAFADHMIAKYQPDVVHFAYLQPFATVAKVLQKRNIPYGITLTDFNIFCHYATIVCKDGTFCTGSNKGEKCSKQCKTYGVKDTQKRYRAAHELLQNADFISTPSQFVANVICSEFPGTAIMVVPHGISKDFDFTESRTSTRKFAFAGTLSPLKGVHLLIDAFKQISGDIELNIYGGGEQGYVNQLKTLAKSDSRIAFHGAVPSDRMQAVYQASDCVIIPSMWFETYNFVLREALMCGCICIASNMGAMPEAIKEGINGFVFDSGSSASLQNALNKALQFDWRKYELSVFPTLEDEAKIYDTLYQDIQGET